MQTNTHNTQPGTQAHTPNARKGHTKPCTQAVLTNHGANWATMVKVGCRAYQVTQVTYQGNGQPLAYTVVTRAGMVATINANHCPQGTYTGYTGNNQHWGTCKLATGLGLTGLNRYAQ